MNRRSLALVMVTYIMWGVQPLVLRLLMHVDTMTILCFRILFSVVFSLALLAAEKKLATLKEAFGSKRIFLLILAASLMLAVHWYVNIWAVNAGHVLDASLGSYIIPLIVLAFSFFFFREHADKMEIAAIVLCVLGVLLRAVSAGVFPLIALSLGVSFGLYGVFVKIAHIGGLTGIAAETLLLCPFALGYLILSPGTLQTLFAFDTKTLLLLVAMGPYTAVPMWLYSRGINDLPFSLIGILQYLCPTMMLLVGVLILHESFSPLSVAAFVLIWIGLILFSTDMVRHDRRLHAVGGSISNPGRNGART